MAPPNNGGTLPSIEEFFVAIENFIDEYKLDQRTKNLLRLSMPAYQAWTILNVCIKERMAKARSYSGIIISEVHKHGFRSDINSRIRLMEFLKRGDLTRDDKRVIEDASLMQIMNLLDDTTDRFKLDDRAFSVLKEGTPLDRTMQLLISVLSNRVLERSKNPSSAIMGQLKIMPPQRSRIESISPPRRARRVSRSRSPPRRRRSIEPENRGYERNERKRSPARQPVQEEPPRYTPPAEPVVVSPPVLSIDAAVATVTSWAEHNRISSRTRHDLLNRIPYDAVLRGISAFANDGPSGEALIRSLEKDPSCLEMPSIESLSREAEDYVSSIDANNSDILATIKQKLFIRDADALVAGQMPSLQHEALAVSTPVLHDRIWFVQSSLAALINGLPLPEPPRPKYAPPTYPPVAPVYPYPPVAPAASAAPAYGSTKYLGGIIIGAPTGQQESRYRR